MTVQTKSSADRAARLAIALTAIAGLILALIVSVSPALGSHTGPLVTPDTTTYDHPGDNPNCTDVLGAGNFDEEQKFDPPSDSTQGHVSMEFDDPFVSFEAADGWLVLVAIVKGGNEGAAVYDYTGLGGVDHDNGLTTPTGQSVSHVTFCLGEAPEESEAPSQTPEGSEAGGTGTPEPSQTPEGSQLGGTGTPAASVPDTAMGASSVTGPLATVAFGLILLASLGALAYANVAAVRRRS